MSRAGGPDGPGRVAVSGDLRAALIADDDEADHPGSFPVRTLALLRSEGFLGLMAPVELGGAGGGAAELVELALDLAATNLTAAFVWAMHCQQTAVVAACRTEPFAAELLSAVAAEGVYLASITTQPGGSGSLLANSSPVAEQGGLLHIEREAPVVTGARHADGFLVTMQDGPGGREDAVSLVYVPAAAAELTKVRPVEQLGMRGLDNVGFTLTASVPRTNVIGPRGQFRALAIDTMAPIGHLGWSACWLGALRGSLGRVTAWLRSRHRALEDQQAERIARVRFELEAAVALLRATAHEFDALQRTGSGVAAPSSQIHLNALKVVASETAARNADRLLAVAGLSAGYADSAGLAVERTLRDLRSAPLTYGNDRLLTVSGQLSLLDRGIELTGMRCERVDPPSGR